ncbi:hypothetical protein BN7_389 [Wickerhamomyces ciferrii]|uniref:Protein kinase domain-containing protein n=1 Tax=Wickerhamomyces ciferrii (strain ATCC 14091 / BCRC 22168 / CBS 111 / JCM 3599 / NBRC 0793 / NRRL Y-1031 F-60-10) TaxID=1206466 RepID=K0K7R3_WICCF|nr:uncharacterized protein BN7_389 [Wickerhamomyces ciferrii]CCH40855.1 hypothetical protein BN7_389 [Wickerhamomyces ciferrii]
MDPTSIDYQKCLDIFEILTTNKERIFKKLKLETGKSYPEMELDFEHLVLSNINQRADFVLMSKVKNHYMWNELMLLIIQNQADFSIDEFNNLWKLILYVETQSSVKGSFLTKSESANKSSSATLHDENAKLVINSNGNYVDVLNYVESGWKMVLSKLEETFNTQNNNKKKSAKLISTLFINMINFHSYFQYQGANEGSEAFKQLKILIQDSIYHKEIIPSVILIDYCYNHNQQERDYSIGCKTVNLVQYNVSSNGNAESIVPRLRLFCADLNLNAMKSEQTISNIEIKCPNLKAEFLKELEVIDDMDLEERFKSKRNIYLNEIISQMFVAKSTIGILTDSYTTIIITIPLNFNFQTLDRFKGNFEKDVQYFSFDIEGFMLSDGNLFDLRGDFVTLNDSGLTHKSILCSLILNHMEYIPSTSSTGKARQLGSIGEEIETRRSNLTQLYNKIQRIQIHNPQSPNLSLPIENSQDRVKDNTQEKVIDLSMNRNLCTRTYKIKSNEFIKVLYNDSDNTKNEISLLKQISEANHWEYLIVKFISRDLVYLNTEYYSPIIRWGSPGRTARDEAYANCCKDHIYNESDALELIRGYNDTVDNDEMRINVPKLLLSGFIKKGDGSILQNEYFICLEPISFIDNHPKNEVKQSRFTIKDGLKQMRLINSLGIDHEDLYARNVSINPQTKEVLIFDFNKCTITEPIPYSDDFRSTDVSNMELVLNGYHRLLDELDW